MNNTIITLAITLAAVSAQAADTRAAAATVTKRVGRDSYEILENRF